MSSARLSPGDPSSFSRPDEVRVTHMEVELDVNFSTKVLAGQVTLSIEKLNDRANVLILDSRDLNISQVHDVNSSQNLNFKIGDKAAFGEKLEISLPEKGTNFKITIIYSTSSKSTALQWLNPEQTLGKIHPFLFSQCQAIHCRSLVPCQDTPSNKITYEAKITAPRELVALMSAIRRGEPVETGGKKTHSFHQPVQIPSYLLALVVGDLQSKRIGPRSHVWSEPGLLEKAAFEFANTESQLKAAEDVCGPYVWGIYDLLVLPPSFPFGGMENPCLTFVTPTMIAGDRSLVDLIAHEIAHSWTGNLVTNSNFEHFWLNEGFTVFVERKINGRLHGEPSRHFAAIGGRTYLADTIKTLGEKNPLTALVPDLTGVDPDDAFSTVPYEKGQAFLWYLEDLVGGPEKFDPFLKSYIENFKFKSIVTSDFLNYLKNYFANTPEAEKLNQVDWNTWLYSPGMPTVFAKYDDTLAKTCQQFCRNLCDWNEKGCCGEIPLSTNDLKNLTPAQLEELLSQLLLAKPLSEQAIRAMQTLYDFNRSQNAEIKFRWLRLCIQAHYRESIAQAVEFATSQGRMKYCRPIFRDLYNWDETRQIALDAYEKVKDQWMYVCAYTVGKDLHVDL